LGLHPDFESAIAEMTHLGETFEPDADRHKFYGELYERVYKRMYKRLQPLYNEIKDVVS
jgi:sugar (pentulose or hexulose) kinase